MPIEDIKVYPTTFAGHTSSIKAVLLLKYLNLQADVEQVTEGSEFTLTDTGRS
jgi:hypothetical protein